MPSSPGLIGVGRYLLPPVLIVIGVLLIHDGKVAHRNRIVLGCILAAVGLLALLHVAAGPDDFPGWLRLGEGRRRLARRRRSVRRCDGSSATPVRSWSPSRLLLAALVIITQVPLKRVAGRAAPGHARRLPAGDRRGRAGHQGDGHAEQRQGAVRGRRRRAPRARLGARAADRAAGAQLGPVRPRHRGARPQEADACHAAAPTHRCRRPIPPTPPRPSASCRSTSARPARPVRGSCPRQTCSGARRRRRSTPRWSRSGVVSWRVRWPRTASRPGWWA